MTLICCACVFDEFILIFVQIWTDITSGRAIEDPSLLSQFLLLTFAVSTEWWSN